MKIFMMLDPRRERLPVKLGFKTPPRRIVPLVQPDKLARNNPILRAIFRQGDPLNPKRIRLEERERLARMVDAVNQQIARSVQFKGIVFDLDEASGRTVAIIRDRQTNEVLKVIPSRQMLTISASLRHISGLLKDERI